MEALQQPVAEPAVGDDGCVCGGKVHAQEAVALGAVEGPTRDRLGRLFPGPEVEHHALEALVRPVTDGEQGIGLEAVTPFRARFGPERPGRTGAILRGVRGDHPDGGLPPILRRRCCHRDRLRA